ncbi:hypothetical protein KIW84_074843, partial [Lathyrus oleraceus]
KMNSPLVIILLMLFHIVALVVSDPKAMLSPPSPPPYHADESTIFPTSIPYQSQSSPSHLDKNLPAANLDKKKKPPLNPPKKSPSPPYRRPPPPPPRSAKPFDFLMLAERWPETYCIIMNQACRKITPSKFVIHGLWPNNDGPISSQPRGCDNSSEPSFSKELQKEWPSLRSYQNTSLADTTLWLNQWKDHGTCSLMTPEKYFEETLKIHKRTNLKFTLIKAGLPPNARRPYMTTEIFDAIKRRIGFNPQIQCIKIGNKFYLQEIRLCLDKSTQHNYIDCPKTYVDCGSNVYFPEKE